MQYRWYRHTLKRLKHQRYVALWVTGGLLAISLLQGLLLWHCLDDRKVHFIPLPPLVTAPFSISRSHVSTGYLADMSVYVAMLRLNYTPTSLPHQMQRLLRYTDPRFYGAFKQVLVKELTLAKAHDVSLAFMPVATSVNEKTLSVLIQGELIRFVGKVALPKTRVTYRITYDYHDGVLRIAAMNRITSSQGEPSHV